jgi:hypothetical protein
MSKIKVLSNILWNAGLKKEAFQIGNLQGLTDEMVEKVISESHKTLNLILKDHLLFGLTALEKLFSNNSKVSFAAKEPVIPGSEEKGTKIILGPKTTDEVVEMLNSNQFLEKRWHLWYDDFVKLMEETLHIMRDEEAYRIFSSVLAATSVQTKPTYNLVVAIEYLYRWVKTDSMEKWMEYLSVTSGEAFQEEDEEEKRGEKKSPEEKFLKRQRKIKKLKELELLEGGTREFTGHGIAGVDKNIKKIFKGDSISGPKIGDYGMALRGDPNAVAVDRHVSRLLLGKDSPKDAKDFEAAKTKVKEVSERMGITPAQAQSAIWCMNLFLTGEKTEDYIGIIRERKEEIRDLLRRSESLYLKFKM